MTPFPESDEPENRELPIPFYHGCYAYRLRHKIPSA
jgi:hypothetical protein